MSRLRIRSDGLHWIESDGEIVALDDHSLQYVSANPAAKGLLWRALVEGATRTQLVARLLAEFEVHEDVATRDVDAFVAELGRLGLLEA